MAARPLGAAFFTGAGVGMGRRPTTRIQGLGRHAAENDHRPGKNAQDHQQIIVLIPGAFIGQRSQARIGKDRLHDIRSAHDMGYGNGHDAQIGGQDVAQAVAQKDFPPALALGFGQQHIIRANFLRQPVADEVGVVPEMGQDHHRQGQDEMHQPVPEIGAFSHGIGTGTG